MTEAKQSLSLCNLRQKTLARGFFSSPQITVNVKFLIFYTLLQHLYGGDAGNNCTANKPDKTVTLPLH